MSENTEAPKWKLYKFKIPQARSISEERRIPGTNLYANGCAAIVIAESMEAAKEHIAKYVKEMNLDGRWLVVADEVELEIDSRMVVMWVA